MIEGVNTGFGGSADTRTGDLDHLQRTLIEDLNCGISAVSATGGISHHNQITNGANHSPDTVALLADTALLNEDPVASTSLPEAWVRAALLIRANTLACGYSGVRPILVSRMVDLLRNDALPFIPLRGSISASGDLSPLSYIAGALQGKPSINVWIGERKNGGRHLVTADAALSELSISPLKLGPKEGLAIVNGTAISTGVGALVMYDAHCLAVLSQVLTAMSVEGLHGTIESFDPFFAAVRPHPGQVEASRNIHSFLAGSSLVHSKDDLHESSLRQDRYSIRTASQWIGPQLENLLLAHKQVTIECNSTTDNPLVDTASGRVLSGGNFQAMAITSAMEKTRASVQIIGRMLFSQCTEMINPATNNGLPPNLAADEPSQSFLMKGVDIMIASLQSELGFLANPVGNHVQTAEMGNQSLNSLALISARYTHVALDVLSQMAAAHLFAACQALDLRAVHIRFLQNLQPAFQTLTFEAFQPLFSTEDELPRLQADLWLSLQEELDHTTKLDSTRRIPHVIQQLQLRIMAFLSSSHEEGTKVMPALNDWAHRCSALTLETFHANRDQYSANPDATQLLGPASYRMYKFVRDELKVPFLRMEFPKPLGAEDIAISSIGQPDPKDSDSTATETVGSLITTIYISIRTGALYVPVVDCLREAQAAGVTNGF